MPDRQHQVLVKARAKALAAAEISDWRTTLIAVPGAGKSRCVVDMATELEMPVIWIAPRINLQRQGAETFREHGLPIGTSHHNPKANGFATNYSALSIKGGVKRHLQAIGNYNSVLVVADEFHHCSGAYQLAEELEESLLDTEKDFRGGKLTGWGFAFDKLIEELQSLGKLGHLFMMSGTPYRQDRFRGSKFLEYESAGHLNGTPLLEIKPSEVNGKPLLYSRAAAKANPDRAVLPLRVSYIDANVRCVNEMTDQEVYYGPISACVDKSLMARGLRSFLEDDKNCQAVIKHALREWAESYGSHKPQMLVTASSIARASHFLKYLYDLRGHFRKEVGRNLKVGIAVAPSTEHKKDPGDKPELLEIGEEGQLERELEAQRYYRAMYKRKVYQHLCEVVSEGKLPESETALVLLRHREMDVLVTVGKAYEGLDAPGCSHLVHLGPTRSVPWLTQCFARAWRRDYVAPPELDQVANIYLPKDVRAIAAVDRIVREDNEELKRIRPKTIDKQGLILNQQDWDRMMAMFGGMQPGVGQRLYGHGAEPSGLGTLWDERKPEDYNEITIEITEEDP